jgi:hypothetical protein
VKLRLLITISFLCMGLLSATTIIPVSVERLTTESSHVVEARALSSWSQWNPQHSLIFTFTKFEVSRTLKGQAPSTIVVKQIGGSAEGYTQKVAGVRHWREGDQAVLFLHPSPSGDGTLEVTGLMQGDFRMHAAPSGTTVSNGVAGVTSYDQNSQQTAPYQGSGMRLEDLESRVQKAVSQ